MAVLKFKLFCGSRAARKGHAFGELSSAMANDAGRNSDEQLKDGSSIVVPVIQEHLTVDKKIVDTASVIVRKQVTEELASLNIPLIQEGYRIEHVAVNKIVDSPPPVREEEGKTIIPVLREVLVVQKKYEIVEEVHIIKEKTAVPHLQEITLRKETVTVERTPLNHDNQS
jgi:uncharacterized protein (TIGR02271 family)